MQVLLQYRLIIILNCKLSYTCLCPCNHQTIWRSQSHTYYTVPCHCPATQRSKQKSLFQSSLNLHFLFGAIRFFTGGSAIAYPENVENSARDYPENAGDYPIGIHHPDTRSARVFLYGQLCARLYNYLIWRPWVRVVVEP